MIARHRHCPREGVSTAAMGDFFALQCRSYHNSSTNSSTKAFLGDNKICKSLKLNEARVAELADAPDLGSGGEIRRGSSPLPGSFPRIKQGFSQSPGHAIIQCTVGRSWDLMACILVVRGTAIATVTSGRFSALPLPKSTFLH